MSAEPDIPPHHLEVGLSEDEREVIINHPVDPETIEAGWGWIAFTPAQALNLARLLRLNAIACKR